MKFGNLKQDKGVAGTAVLLGLIVALFVIGLLVMIFALMGASLQQNSFSETSITSNNVTTNRVVNATGAFVNGYNPTTYRNCALTITAVRNSSDGVLITSGNYTVSGCLINGSTASAPFINQLWKVNGTVTYDADTTATDVINDTTTSISSVTTFFSLFIVIGSMVVLILLTVIIIVAIKQSGMLGDGTA